MKVVLVTVGTTKFDKLISKVTSAEFISTLKAKGCRKLIIQSGNSHISAENLLTLRNSISIVEQFSFTGDLTEFIAEAELVISHAGAGTCSEVQEAGKGHVVVVNEALMNNHQAELAEKLAELGHLKHCVCENLTETVRNFRPERDLNPLKAGKIYFPLLEILFLRNSAFTGTITLRSITGGIPHFKILFCTVFNTNFRFHRLHSITGGIPLFCADLIPLLLCFRS